MLHNNGSDVLSFFPLFFIMLSACSNCLQVRHGGKLGPKLVEQWIAHETFPSMVRARQPLSYAPWWETGSVESCMLAVAWRQLRILVSWSKTLQGRLDLVWVTRLHSTRSGPCICRTEPKGCACGAMGRTRVLRCLLRQRAVRVTWSTRRFWKVVQCYDRDLVGDE